MELEVLSNASVVGDRLNRGVHVSESVRLEYIRKYEASGLKQRDYTDREGLVYTTFLGWLRKHRRKEREAEGKIRFSEVRLGDAGGSEYSTIGTVSLEVSLPSGVVLRGRDAADLARLYRLIVTSR